MTETPPAAAVPPTPSLRLRFAAISDVGRVRKDNQDSGYVGPWLLAVCDGVGGAARGDIASSTAIAQLRRLDAPPGDEPEHDLLARVAGALHRAHDRIGELVDQDPALDGTSTTATLALFDGFRVAIGHVGDSRAYLYRDGEIARLTSDHTFVQTLIDEGRITEADARVHPHRNLILKALDGVHEAEPDLFVIELQRATGCCCAATAPAASSTTGGSPTSSPPAAPTSRPSSWCARASRPAAPTTSPASSPTWSTPPSRPRPARSASR
jgi:protein phosphatase